MKSLLLLLAYGLAIGCCEEGKDTTAIEQSTTVKVTKCCSSGDIVDVSDLTSPKCTTGGGSGQLGNIIGLDLKKEIGSRKINITLRPDSNHQMPTCTGGYDVTSLSESGPAWVTAEGHLVVQDNQHELRHSEFCVDSTQNGLVAISCPACTPEHPCVNLCCPHGHALLQDPEDPEYEACAVPTEGNNSTSPEFWDEHDRQLQDWQDNHKVILKAASTTGDNCYPEFKCPDDLVREDLHLMDPDFEVGNYKIQPDGSLKGENIGYTDLGVFHGETYGTNGTLKVQGKGKGNFTWKRNQFCASFADKDYDYEFDGEMTLTYATCFKNTPPDKEAHQDFLANFSPVALGVSIFFLILTLSVYLWSKNINKQDIGVRMKIALIFNMIIAYTISVIIWTKDEGDLGTLSCKAAGYFLQYFALSFLFWTSTLGFDIWTRFTFPSTRGGARGEGKKLLFYALYAQGVPLLISIVTSIVDATRPLAGEKSNPCFNSTGKLKITAHYPNMGDLKCFLGESKGKVNSYFGTAGFLYFDMFTILILVSNLYFLGSVCWVLHKGWENQANLRGMTGDQMSVQERFHKGRKQATIIIRLFIILGIPWILNIVSSGLEFKQQNSQNGATDKSIRWVTFTSNLAVFFAGFLIFLTLVVKKALCSDLRQQASVSAASMGLVERKAPAEGEEMTQMSSMSQSGD